MKNKKDSSLITIASLVIITAGIHSARSILVPVLLSILIAIAIIPFLIWLQDKKIPRLLAMLIVILTIAGAGFILTVLIGSSVDEFSQNLPHYKTLLREKMSQTATWLEGMGIEISRNLFLKYFEPKMAIDFTKNAFGAIGKIFSNTFLILLTVIFILLEASGFPQKLKVAFENDNRSVSRLNEVVDKVKHYIAIKTATSLTTGMLVGIWLALIGIDYPLIWGLMAFFFNYVPNIGSIIAAVPAIIFVFLLTGVFSALLTAAGYLVINVLIGVIIEPRVIGEALGMSTLVVFLSLLFWGWILGPIGVLIAAPLTMILQIVLENHEDMRWIAILMGSRTST